MPEPKQRAIVIRDLESFEDLQQAEVVEKEVWALADRDVLPMTMAVATKAAGSIWIGAFDGRDMAGFAFGFLGVEQGHLMLHSHMLAVREPYRDLDVGHKLKLAQRDRAIRKCWFLNARHQLIGVGRIRKYLCNTQTANKRFTHSCSG